MGTKIYESHGLHVKRFYGGKDRGVCWSFYGEGDLDIEELENYLSLLKASLSEMLVKATDGGKC